MKKVQKSQHRKSPQSVFYKKTEEALAEAVIRRARGTGKLNLSNHNLDKVPEYVFRIDTLSSDEKANLNVNFDTSDSESKWWDIAPLTVLDLSNNAIQNIPSEIQQLCFLTHLLMQHNSINTIADEIRLLENLNYLYLDHNKMRELPKGVYCLTNLKTLSVSHNVLETVANDIGNLSMLISLNLSNNELSFIPDNIGFLGRLSDLNLSHNYLQKVPIELTTICGLTKLNLSHNKLEELPTLEFLGKLEELNLQCNRLKVMPDVSNCVKLYTLDVSVNVITEFDGKMLNNLMTLRVLYLSNNKLVSLPEEVCNLVALTSLDVSNNSLNELPSNLCNLKHLRHLLVAENLLPTIPRHIIACGTQRLLRFLKDRYSSKQADELLESDDTLEAVVEKMRFSKKMQVHNGSRLNTEALVQAAVTAQANVISFVNHQLIDLPKNFHELGRFAREVDLGKNNLTELPSYIQCFSHLLYLNLARNRLTALPSELANCHQLKELHIDYNNFTEVPVVVYKLTSLEILSAKGNVITLINVDGLMELKRLAVLDLSDNNIAHVPVELGNMTMLRCLKIEGNIFRVPNYGILERGTLELLKYLRDKIPQ